MADTSRNSTSVDPPARWCEPENDDCLAYATVEIEGKDGRVLHLCAQHARWAASDG